MDVRQLQAFQAIIEYKSLTRAALALSITQPAMSALISRLEKRVGVVLFRREKRRLIPTPEATHLYAEVVQALSGLSRLSLAVQDIRQAKKGTLTIAAHPTASIDWLPPLIAKFQSERPGTYVRVATRSSQLLREMTPANSFDIGLAQIPIESKNVVIRPYRLKCVAVLPCDHRLANHDSITPQLLDNEPFITMPRWHPLFRSVGRAFNEAAARWNTVAECEFFATALSLVSEGLGVSVVESISADARALQGKIVIRPFKPETTYSAALFYAADQPISLLAAEFIELFEEVVAKHVINASSG